MNLLNRIYFGCGLNNAQIFYFSVNEIENLCYFVYPKNNRCTKIENLRILIENQT